MAIKKRLKRTITKKKTIKRRPTLKNIDYYYNRLQEGRVREVKRPIIDAVFGKGRTVSEQVLVEYLMAMFDTTVRTLQVNYTGECVTFTVCMKWTDRSQKPTHGHIFPSMSAISTATTLTEAVIFSYVKLSKQAGKWVKP